jgi:hypothetical protein
MSMNVNENGVPQLNVPLDLSTLSDTELQNEAAVIAKATPFFTEDQIVDQLTFLKENGIALEQKNIDNLVAGNPILTPPDIADYIFSAAALDSVDGPNYWLSPTPLVAFVVIYLNLQAELSKMKVVEAQMLADSIALSAELAKETAEIIIKVAEAERAMHIASAVAGAITAVASIASFARASKLRSQGADEGTIMANTQLIGQGGSALGTIMEKAMHAQYTLVKGQEEALKTLVESTTRIAQRRLESASDTYKAIEEVMQQFLQNLQKLIDENLKAHGFQVH